MSESVENAINDPVGGGIFARPPPFNDRVLFQLDSKGLSLQASRIRILIDLSVSLDIS